MPAPRFLRTRYIAYTILDLILRPWVHALAFPYLGWLWWNHVPLLSWTFVGATLIYVAVNGILVSLREVAADDRIWTKYY